MQPQQQGYAPQYQPNGAQPGQPQFIPPQYPATPAGYPPQSAPQQQAPGGDPFADPSRGGGGLAPKMRHLEGRTVIFEPLRVDETTTGKNGESRPTAYAHMTVVDGPPIMFGDDLDKHTPATHKINIPARFTNVMIGNTWIVNAIRDDLPPMGRGLLLGVIVRGQLGNKPYLLTKVSADENGNERPDGEARRAAALNLWRAHESGQWTSPVPELLPQQQYAPAQQVSYGYAPQPQQSYGPTNAQAGYVPGAGQQPTQNQYATANPGTGQPQNWVPQQHAQQSALANAQPTPGMLGVPGSAFDVNANPPGWDAAMWAGFNTEQRAGVWAQINAAGQQGPMGGPPQQPNPGHPGF